jgi:hypothetical protein
MELEYINALKLGGFNYDNCIRNKAIESGAGILPPRAMKTGTTICGAIYKVNPLRCYNNNFT